MEHETAKLRARITALESERDALRAELVCVRAETVHLRGELARLQDLARNAYARGGADTDLAARETVAMASATMQAELQAMGVELAYARAAVHRIQAAYDSASAQAASYRKLRDEAYREGRADERAALDELASKLSPLGPGCV